MWCFDDQSMTDSADPLQVSPRCRPRSRWQEAAELWRHHVSARYQKPSRFQVIP